MEYGTLNEPAHLCAICRLPEEWCDETLPGPHIYDGLDFPWVVVDEDRDIVSFHLTRTECLKALGARG